MPKHLQLEDSEQIALFEWARLEPHPFDTGVIADYLFAVPNGPRLSMSQAKKMKRMGLKAGVSDVMLAYPLLQHGWAGLWVELKKQRQHFRCKSEAERAVSDEQRAWLERMNRVGYIAAPAYGWEEAREQIVRYLAHGR